MKRCCRCKAEKPLTREFFAYETRSKDGFGNWCLVCKREYSREWRTNPAVKAQKNALARERRKRPDQKARIWRYRIRRTYGLEPAEYDAMLEQQGYRCAICGGGEQYQLEVDHCHDTHAIRQLLCPPCNKVLGLSRDNVETLERAAAYLRRHRTIEPTRYLPPNSDLYPSR